MQLLVFAGDQFIYLHRLTFAFHHNQVQRAGDELAAHLLVGGFADHITGAVELVGAFQAGGQVDLIAQHGIIEHLARAHVAHDHVAGVDPHPAAQHRPSLAPPNPGELLEAVLHLQRGMAGIGRMVIVIYRRAEFRHDRIPFVLIDDPIILQDELSHLAEILIDQHHQLAGRQAFRDGGKAGHIGEQHRHHPLFPAEGELLRMRDQFLHHFGRHVMGKGPEDALLFLAGQHELVEIGRYKRKGECQGREDHLHHDAGAAEQQYLHQAQQQNEPQGDERRPQRREAQADHLHQQYQQQHNPQREPAGRLVKIQIAQNGMSGIGENFHSRRLFRCATGAQEGGRKVIVQVGSGRSDDDDLVFKNPIGQKVLAEIIEVISLGQGDACIIQHRSK